MMKRVLMVMVMGLGTGVRCGRSDHAYGGR